MINSCDFVTAVFHSFPCSYKETYLEALEAALTFKLPFKVTEFEATILMVSEFKSLTLDGMNKPALAFVFGAKTKLELVVVAIVPCKRMFANVKTAFYVSFKWIFSLLVSKLSKSGSEMRREASRFRLSDRAA